MTGSALHCSGCEQLLRPLLTSVRPSRHLAAPVAHGRSNRSPRVIRATFLLMPVGSTSQRSVQVLGFGNFGYLTPLHRLIRFLFVRPAFCLGLPSDSQSPTTPLPLANTSPCRVCRGLSPPSRPAHHHWCQWPLILTHFWPIELTHLLTANRRFSASNDSSHLPA